MRRVQTDAAPEPGGHYAQGVAHGGFLFVSGQLPIDPNTGETSTGSIEEQTERALANVIAVVEAAGADKGAIVKTTVYIADVSDWARVNAVYARCFGLYRPARAIVPVLELHHGARIEIDAVAALPS